MNAGTPDMQRWRRATLLVVCLLALLASGSAAGQAAPTAPITLTVVGPAQPVPAGQTFLVTIRASQAMDLGAFEFGVSFNPAVLSTHPDWMALTGLLGSTGRTTGELRLGVTAAPGQPVFGAYSYGTAAGPAGAGDLATIQFYAVAAGVSAVTLMQVQVTDTEANVTPVTVVAGSVRVTPSGAVRKLYLPVLMRRG